MAFLAWTRPKGEPRSGSRCGASAAAAIGTSIDAMSVGVPLAFLEVNILASALAIGAATMVTSSAGLVPCRFIGARLGRIAETRGARSAPSDR